jgi:hypothetical protein
MKEHLAALCIEDEAVALSRVNAYDLAMRVSAGRWNGLVGLARTGGHYRPRNHVVTFSNGSSARIALNIMTHEDAACRPDPKGTLKYSAARQSRPAPARYFPPMLNA